MCGESARTRFTSSCAGRARSSSRSAGVIFSAYVTPSSGCGSNAGAGASTSSSSSAAISARAREDRAGVVLRPDRERPLRRDRAGVELRDRAMDRDAGLRVAGHQRALDRRGTAPARQQRRVHVEPERRVRAARPGSAGRTRRRRRCRRRGRRRRRAAPAARTGMPSRSAVSFAGVGASVRPRPRGLSGRVSRSATSCAAASRSSTSAPNGAVAATAIRARH